MKLEVFLYILGILLSLFALNTWSVSELSFGDAKAVLRNQIYVGFETTFYCECAFQKNTIKEGCFLELKKHKKRSKRLEWEHIVPAHAFGQSFKEWRDSTRLCPQKNKKHSSGRKCARKLNKEFRIMEGDLHNLVPAIGSVNALRSNYSFDDIKVSELQVCGEKFKISGRKVSPAENKKGDVARIYMYMDQQYPNHGIISNKNQKLFESWNKLDPVDQNECEIYKRKIAAGANSFKLWEDGCFIGSEKK